MADPWSLIANTVASARLAEYGVRDRVRQSNIPLRKAQGRQGAGRAVSGGDKFRQRMQTGRQTTRESQ